MMEIKTESFEHTAPHKCQTQIKQYLHIPMTSSTSVNYMISTQTGIQTASVFTSNTTHCTLRHEVSLHQTFAEEERLIGNKILKSMWSI